MLNTKRLRTSQETLCHFGPMDMSAALPTFQAADKLLHSPSLAAFKTYDAHPAEFYPVGLPQKNKHAGEVVQAYLAAWLNTHSIYGRRVAPVHLSPFCRISSVMTNREAGTARSTSDMTRRSPTCTEMFVLLACHFTQLHLTYVNIHPG
jgi:hypothetical protein